MRISQNSDSLGDPNNSAPVFQARTILSSQSSGALSRLAAYMSDTIEDLNNALGEIKQYYIGSIAGAIGMPSGLTSITALGMTAPTQKWANTNLASNSVPIGLTADGKQILIMPSGAINYANHYRAGQVFNMSLITKASGFVDSQLECDCFTQPDYASGVIDAMIGEPLYSPNIELDNNYSAIVSNASIVDAVRDLEQAMGNNEFVSSSGYIDGEQTFKEGRLSHTDNINRIQNKYFYVNWCIDLDMIDASVEGNYWSWDWQDIEWRTDSWNKSDMATLLECGARIDTRAGGVVFMHNNALLTRQGSTEVIPTTANISTVTDSSITINMPKYPDNSSYLQTGNYRITAYIPVAIPLRLLTGQANHRWGHRIEPVLLKAIGRQYGYGVNTYPRSVASRLDSLEAILTWLNNSIEPYKTSRNRFIDNLPGTRQYTIPAGVHRILVLVKGAGACGGSGTSLQNTINAFPNGVWVVIAPGKGGGEGGFLVQLVDVTPGQVVTYTVGQGGLRVSTPCPASTGAFEALPIGNTELRASNNAGTNSVFYLAPTADPSANKITCYGGSSSSSYIIHSPFANCAYGGGAGAGGAAASSIPKSSIFTILGSLGYINHTGQNGKIYTYNINPALGPDYVGPEYQVRTAVGTNGIPPFPSIVTFGGADRVDSNFCGLSAGAGGGSSAITLTHTVSAKGPTELNVSVRAATTNPQPGGNGTVAILHGAKVDAITEDTFTEETIASMLGNAINSY